MANIFEIFDSKIVQSVLTIIIIVSYLMALRSVRRSARKNSLIQKTVLTKKSIWDDHPQKKFYFNLRRIFHVTIAIGLMLKIAQVFFKMSVSNLLLVDILFAALVCFVLLVVKCPRCEASLFLQEVNSELMKLPKICLKCGYPTDDLSKEDSQIAIRPAFKMAFLVFMVIPILLIVVTLLYLFFTGQMH